LPLPARRLRERLHHAFSLILGSDFESSYCLHAYASRNRIPGQPGGDGARPVREAPPTGEAITAPNMRDRPRGFPSVPFPAATLCRCRKTAESEEIRGSSRTTAANARGGCQSREWMGMHGVRYFMERRNTAPASHFRFDRSKWSKNARWNLLHVLERLDPDVRP
jgi:hypothetical protein